MNDFSDDDFALLRELLKKAQPADVRDVPTVENFLRMLLVARDAVPEPENDQVLDVLARFTLQPVTGATRKVARASRRVCLIERRDGSEATACLIGPDLILTAAHALRGTAGIFADPHQVLVKFDEFMWNDKAKAYGAVCGLKTNTAGDQPDVVATSIKIDANGNIYEDSKLDYVIVRLDRAIGNARLPFSDWRIRGWMDVHKADIVPEAGPVNVLQHPHGQLLHLSDGVIPVRENLLGIGRGRFRYHTPAHPGTSGAPILNQAKILVGMHVGTVSGEQEGISWQAIFNDLNGLELQPNPGHEREFAAA